MFQAPSIPSISYKPSADCAYSMLVNKIAGIPSTYQNQEQIPHIEGSPPQQQQSRLRHAKGQPQQPQLQTQLHSIQPPQSQTQSHIQMQQPMPPPMPPYYHSMPVNISSFSNII